MIILPYVSSKFVTLQSLVEVHRLLQTVIMTHCEVYTILDIILSHTV